MKYLKLILSLSIFIGSISVFTQTDFSGIVYYESTISKKILKEYLKKKENNTINSKLTKTLDKVYFQSKPIKSKIVFSNGKGFYKVEDNMKIDKMTLVYL